MEEHDTHTPPQRHWPIVFIWWAALGCAAVASLYLIVTIAHAVASAAYQFFTT